MIHIAILTTGDDRASERHTSAVVYFQTDEDHVGRRDFEAEWKHHHEAIDAEVLVYGADAAYDNVADEIINRMTDDGWIFPPSDCLEVEYN